MSRSTVQTVSAIALTAWASFGFEASARQQLGPHSPDTSLRRPETDRLASVRIGQELISSGCEGEQVSLLQALLNSRGASPSLKVSGVFDHATDVALRDFQSRHRSRSGAPLSKDGVVGMETLFALEHPEAAPTRAKQTGILAEVLNQVRLYKEGDKGPAVLELKRLLNNAGASPKLRETETFDSAMSHAVVTFQSRWNIGHTDSETPRLPIDGVIKRRTAEALVQAGSLSGLSSAVQNVERALSGKMHGPAAPANYQTFENALTLVLKFEGGLSTDRRDHGNKGGNVTMHGVTQGPYDQYRALHHQPLRSVSHITSSEVKQLYYELYWIGGKCGRLPQPLAIAHFNTCINMGPRAAAAILQQTLDVHVDRQIGPKTIRAAYEVDAYSATEIYLKEVESRYHKVAKCGANQTFLNGWLTRLDAVRIACGVGGTRLPPMIALSSPAPEADYGVPFSEGIRNFQNANGLNASGIIDDATESALQKN